MGFTRSLISCSAQGAEGTVNKRAVGIWGVQNFLFLVQNFPQSLQNSAQNVQNFSLSPCYSVGVEINQAGRRKKCIAWAAFLFSRN